MAVQDNADLIAGPVQLRQAVTGDVNAIARIETACFGDPWSVQGIEDALTYSYSTMLTAVLGGDIVGFACLYQMVDEGEIVQVAVTPKFQGQGIGRQLLGGLIRHGIEHGVTRFILDVRVSNDRAVKLYEKAGFKKLALQKNFYSQPTEDGWLMEMLPQAPAL